MNDFPQPTGPATAESAWAYMRECNHYLSEMFAKARQEFAETERLMKERSIEADRRIAETDRQMKETDRQIKLIHKEIGGMSKSNGEVAEEYFFNSFSKDLIFAGQKFDRMIPNIKPTDRNIKIRTEFDLVLYNCNVIAIIEIKYKARKRDIESLLKKPDFFRLFFPEYGKYEFYLGLAGLTVEDDAEAEAKTQGIAVIKQVGENMVVSDEHLKVF